MVSAPELCCQHETSRTMATTFAVVSAHRYEGPPRRFILPAPDEAAAFSGVRTTPYRLDRTMTEENTKPEADLIELTTDIVAAYVSNNPVPSRIPCLRANCLGLLPISMQLLPALQPTPFPNNRKKNPFPQYPSASRLRPIS